MAQNNSANDQIYSNLSDFVKQSRKAGNRDIDVWNIIGHNYDMEADEISETLDMSVEDVIDSMWRLLSVGAISIYDCETGHTIQ
jgi:predicted transcriptional regulator